MREVSISRETPRPMLSTTSSQVAFGLPTRRLGRSTTRQSATIVSGLGRRVASKSEGKRRGRRPTKLGTSLQGTKPPRRSAVVLQRRNGLVASQNG